VTLLVSITNTLGYTAGSYVATNTSGSGVFNTIGAGARYLADDTYRNSGTTNIDSGLLAELRERTTYPPIVLSNAITSDTLLFPQAMRDTDDVDLGYHYSPLDYALSQVSVSNASLTIQPGTSIGVYGPSTASGLILLDGANVVGSAETNARGAFAIALDKPLTPGQHELSVRSTAPGPYSLSTQVVDPGPYTATLIAQCSSGSAMFQRDRARARA